MICLTWLNRKRKIIHAVYCYWVQISVAIIIIIIQNNNNVHSKHCIIIDCTMVLYRVLRGLPCRRYIYRHCNALNSSKQWSKNDCFSTYDKIAGSLDTSNWRILYKQNTNIFTLDLIFFVDMNEESKQILLQSLWMQLWLL